MTTLRSMLWDADICKVAGPLQSKVINPPAWLAVARLVPAPGCRSLAHKVTLESAHAGAIARAVNVKARAAMVLCMSLKPSNWLVLVGQIQNQALRHPSYGIGRPSDDHSSLGVGVDEIAVREIPIRRRRHLPSVD